MRAPLTRLLVAVGALSILGCSTVPRGTADETTLAQAGQAPLTVRSAADADADGRAQARDAAAHMFQIIAAEVALQRGEAASSFATLMQVAKETSDPRIARRATEVALTASAGPQALEAATLWQQLAPASVEATQTVTALLVANNKLDDVRRSFEASVRAAKEPTGELLRAQRSLARASDRAAGFAVLEKLVAPWRDDASYGVDARLILAQGAQQAGMRERALAEAQGALSLKPDSERAATAVAQLMSRQDKQDGEAETPRGDRAGALQLLAGFLERQPAANEVRNAYGRLLIENNQLREAQAQFATLTANDPNNLDAWYMLGLLAMQSEERPTARAAFKRYLDVANGRSTAAGGERDPDTVYLNLSRLAEEDKNYAEALSWLDRIDGGEQFFTARARRALVLGKMSRFDEARALLAETTAASDEERVQLALAEGQLLRDARRYRESFDVLNQALNGNPNDASLLYDTAMAAEKINRIDEMETKLRRLMQIKPDYAHAYNALGYTLADRNLRLQEAHDLVAQALKLAPDDAFILDSQGWVFFRQGRLAQARDTLERAYKSKPEADVAAHFGEVLWALGERDAAKRVWLEGVSREPDNETLGETLRRLKVKLP